MKRVGVVASLILAFCGLADSAYLAEHVASNTPVICNIQGLSDCNTVIESQYSHIFGIHLADLGVLFYSILFVLAALEIIIFDAFLRRVLQAGSLVGILASLYFVYQQAFVIRAFCVYCLTSASITLFILFFASFIEPIKIKRNSEPSPVSSPPRLTMPPPAS
jgi:uncharacterized membrane protein